MGGSTREWNVELLDDVIAGSQAQIVLTMTKHEGPDVSIGWELVLER